MSSSLPKNGEYEDAQHPIRASLSERIHPSKQEPPHAYIVLSTYARGYSCWSACLDAPCLAPSFSSPPLVCPAPQPPSIDLDSCTSMPGYPCWSACLDAPCLAPSNSSPPLVCPAPQPPSIALDPKTS